MSLCTHKDTLSGKMRSFFFAKSSWYIQVSLGLETLKYQSNHHLLTSLLALRSGDAMKFSC